MEHLKSFPFIPFEGYPDKVYDLDYPMSTGLFILKYKNGKRVAISKEMMNECKITYQDSKEKITSRKSALWPRSEILPWRLYQLNKKHLYKPSEKKTPNK